MVPARQRMNEIEARLAQLRPELAATERKVQEARETRELLQDAAKAATVATINTPGTAADRTAVQARDRLQQALTAERKWLDADEDTRASIQQLEAERSALADTVGAEERAAALQDLSKRIEEGLPVARAWMANVNAAAMLRGVLVSDPGLEVVNALDPARMLHENRQALLGAAAAVKDAVSRGEVLP